MFPDGFGCCFDFSVAEVYFCVDFLAVDGVEDVLVLAECLGEAGVVYG